METKSKYPVKIIVKLVKTLLFFLKAANSIDTKIKNAPMIENIVTIIIPILKVQGCFIISSMTIIINPIKAKLNPEKILSDLWLWFATFSLKNNVFYKFFY